MKKALSFPRALRLIGAIALLGVVVFAGVHTLGAFSSGVVGRSGNPETNGGSTCSGCHQGGTEPTVTLSGDTAVAVGETVRYTLTISGGQADDASAPNPGGGFNVSASGGALAPLSDATDVQAMPFPNTSLVEVTHTEPKPVDGMGEVVFEFQWTAPGVPGDVTLYGAGNSVNGNFSPTGDAAATDQLTITVTGEARYLPVVAGGSQE